MSKLNQENVNPNKVESQTKLLDDDQSHLLPIRNRFEKEIQKRGDDSIDIWLNYLEWSDQLYIEQQIKKQEIIDLYNRALTCCKRNKTYQNDPRLLKIFMNYINKHESRKLDWLSWMNQHKYCVKLSQFYIDYSKILENTDRPKAFILLRNALKTNVMSSDQSKIVKDYLEELRFRVSEEDINKSDQQNQEPETNMNIKFAFSFLMLKPNPNSDEEFQFEEIKARKYSAIYLAKIEAEQKYESEISQLKKKLAEYEASFQKTEKCEMATNTSMALPPTTVRLNKTRDMTINKTTNRQSLLGTTYNTTTFNNTNFTDVTRFNNEDSDDMILTDDEDFDKTKNRSISPQPQNSLQAPSNFSVTNIETEVTLANVRNSMMTTFADATFANKTITTRTNEARRMAEKMFNQTDNTGVFDKSETDTNTLPSISIYKDPTILSETQTNTTKRDQTILSQNDENIKFESKKKNMNQDGSMFVYDQVENKDRKPLGIIADTQSQPMSSFNTTINEPTTNISKFMEFEPPAASTRSIKPLLKKMNDFNDQNMLETIIDTTFDQEVQKLRELKNQDEEKEKLLNAHFDQAKNDTDKNISNLLAQDFNTQTIKWSNYTQKTQKQVKFNMVVNNEVTSKIPNVTNMNNMTGIQWDYSYLEVDNATKKQKLEDSKLNITENQTLPSLTIPNITLSAPPLSQPEPEPEFQEPDSEKGVLTQQNLEQRFNNDYYKLFYEHSIFNNTSLNVSKVMIDKLMDDDEDDDDKPQPKENIKEKTIIEEDETNMITHKTNALGVTTLPDISNNSVSMSSTDTSMTVANLNETLMSAIREPFNIEIKNKLLDKGPIETLKNNPNFGSLKVLAPTIREKIFITLKDSVDYKIIREIGKGSFAKIYLIEQKGTKKKMALKVDKQATSWEFFITESLHERLLKMKEDKEMKVNVMDSFIRMNQFIKYQNGCFSAMNYYDHGSLLDLINFHVNNEAKYPSFPYWFVLYLTLEMLYILQYLHKAKIIHADIKPDNLIVNQLPESVTYFDPMRTKCLVLIDFNRSIDLNLLGDSVEFEAKIDNKSLLIPEMKEERPWSYQVDFYGILCSIHCVVFKKYMKTYKDKDRNKFIGTFPRGYDKLFENLFDTYLNVPSCSEFPDIDTNFIENFKRMFMAELAQSFGKSKQYLSALKEHFNQKNK